MKCLLKILGKILKVLFVVVAVLFCVYFWNLDQKFMALFYKIMNTVFDRKKADIKF